MERYIEVNKDNIEEFINKCNVLVCKLRNSRIKSKQLAIIEILFLMYDLNVIFIKNGPLGDVKGIISFFVEKNKWDLVIKRLSNIGYCNEFFYLNFDDKNFINSTNIRTINALNWKGKNYSLYNLFYQDEKIYEQQSPHNRIFKILNNNGEVKTIKGYRGNGKELGKRALPVEDARCLVNLSMPFISKSIIEPFAGGGGIVYMYKNINPNINITSIDIDISLKPGLEYYNANHIVGNSSDIVLEDIYDAIVTEVPFSDNATNSVINSIKNLYNNLDNNGLIVLMCGINQDIEIYNCLYNELGSNLIFKKELNRKGTDVVIQIWSKNKDIKRDLENTINIIIKTF